MNDAGYISRLEYSKGFCIQPARDADTVGFQLLRENIREGIIVPAVFDQFP